MNANIALFLSIILPVAFATLCAALYRWWVRRDKRRSPLRGKLHHTPGEQLLTRIRDHDDEINQALMMMFLSGPIFMLAWALQSVVWEDVKFGIAEGMFVVAAVGMFGWGLHSFIRHAGNRRNAREGLAAERMTAQELNRLIGSGCQVLHDVPGDGFNLDHVVISPRGVFMVETKSFKKPVKATDDRHYKVQYDGKALLFPNWSSVKPIDQARKQAQWLARYLRTATNQQIPVIATVALPGWWIDLVKGSASADVRVFTPMGRGAQFMLDLNQQPPLDPSVRALITQALVLRYPDAET